MKIGRYCIFFMLIFFMSCSKYEDMGDTFAYVGFMRAAEDSSLYINTEFVMLDTRITDLGGSGDKQRISFTTDNTGYFAIQFKKIRQGEQGIYWPGKTVYYALDCPGQFGIPINVDGRYYDYVSVYIKK